MREIKFRAWMSKSKEMLDAVDLNTMCILNGGLGLSDSAILLQYTGVEDSAEDEIYEGDILYDEDEDYKGVVEFKNGGFMTDARGFGFEYLESDGCFKIIGNIYENRELLK